VRTLLGAGRLAGTRGAVRAFSLEVDAQLRAGRVAPAEGLALKSFAGWLGDAVR
jgi:hypothetical protein